MSTAPQDIADPLDDYALGLEGLSPDEKRTLCELAECLIWADRVPFVRALIEVFQEHGPDLTDDRGWSDLHGWKGWVLGEQLARAAGLPHNLSDPNLHCCQPEQMEFLLRRLSGAHSFHCETVEETAFTRMLYLLIACRLFELFRTLPFAKALDEAWIIGIQCVYHYGFAKSQQRWRLEALRDLIAWFRDTDGFHRPDGSIDSEAAAMRAYLRGDFE
jgi:hypothetical protein